MSGFGKFLPREAVRKAGEGDHTQVGFTRLGR